jgi:hypothetical protein
MRKVYPNILGRSLGRASPSNLPPASLFSDRLIITD